MDSVRLVEPCLRYRAQYYEVQSEFRAIGEEPTFGFHFDDPDFDRVLKSIDDYSRGLNLPAGEGRRTVYWLIREHDDRLLATINIRSLDTEYFERFGGNIGYSVRPSERRKGYATKMLSLGLDECRRRGLETALVTCNPDNVGSIRTIINNGGVLECETKDRDGERYLRFNIDLRGRVVRDET